MAEIIITTDELSDAQNFLVQYLRDAGYDGSLEDGTAVYDIVIKGMSLLYLLFKKDVDKAESYLSIARAMANKELLGDELDTVIDTILGNWFVTRKGGTKTIGKLRLVYSTPREFAQLHTDTPIISANLVQFVPIKDYTLTSTDFVSVINSVGTGVEYYVDIDVVSLENDSSEILPDTPLKTFISDIYFLRAEVVGEFVPGTLQESNDDFIFRTKKAITTRELVTERAIETVLMDKFSGIDSVYVAGYGDVEQMRDHTSFDFVDVHVGNKADIYVGCDLTQTALELTIPPSEEVVLNTYFAEVIEANVVTTELDSENKEVEVLTPTEYEWVNVEESLFAAVGELRELRFPECIAGDVIRLNVLSHLLPTLVEEFVTDKEQRVACYYPIVKTKFPIVLGLTLGVVAPHDILTDDEIRTVVETEITKFIIGLKSGDVFVLSELIAHLHKNIPYLAQVLLPVEVQYYFTDPNTGIKLTGSLVNEFSIPETVTAGDGTVTEMSKQMSWNTIQFYTSTNLLEVTVNS